MVKEVSGSVSHKGKTVTVNLGGVETTMTADTALKLAHMIHRHGYRAKKGYDSN